VPASLIPAQSLIAHSDGVPRWARPHARAALSRSARAQEVRFDSIQRAAAPAPAGAAAGGAYAGALPAAGGPSAAPGNGASGAWAGGAAGPAGGGFTDSGLLSAGRQEYDCPCAPGSCQGPEVLYTFRAAQQGFVQARRRSVLDPNQDLKLFFFPPSAMREHAPRSGGQSVADARQECPPDGTAGGDASRRLWRCRPSERCNFKKVASCSPPCLLACALAPARGRRRPRAARADVPTRPHAAQVTSQPYYAAEDIGIAGQGSCAHGGCFFGVMHYIYKARRPGRRPCG